MSKKQIIKLLCLNLGIALLNVILFSAGFVGLNFSGDALTTALGVTVIVMSIVTFSMGIIQYYLNNHLYSYLKMLSLLMIRIT